MHHSSNPTRQLTKMIDKGCHKVLWNEGVTKTKSMRSSTCSRNSAVISNWFCLASALTATLKLWNLDRCQHFGTLCGDLLRYGLAWSLRFFGGGNNPQTTSKPFSLSSSLCGTTLGPLMVWDVPFAPDSIADFTSVRILVFLVFPPFYWVFCPEEGWAF